MGRWTTRAGRAKRRVLPKSKDSPKVSRTATMAIMEAAELARRRAIETGEERHLLVAHLAVAADLAERNVGDAEGLRGAAEAAEKYAARARTEDIMLIRGLPPTKGPVRASAVRVLLERAAQAERHLRKHPGDVTRVAEFLCLNAQLAGLGIGREVRAAWLAGKLRGDDLKGHVIARWTLEAVGVSRKTADNWISAVV